MSRRWWLYGPIGISFVVVVSVGFFLSQGRHRILQTNAVVLAGEVAVLRSGETACQTGVAPSAPFRQVQVWGVGSGSTPLRFLISVTADGRRVAGGRGRSTGYKLQPLAVHLDRTVGSRRVVSVCVRNTSSAAGHSLRLAGSASGGSGPTASITPALQQLVTPDGRVSDRLDLRVDMLRDTPASGLSLVPVALRRAAESRPFGTLALWVALAAAVILIPGLLGWSIRSAWHGEVDEADAP